MDQRTPLRHLTVVALLAVLANGCVSGRRASCPLCLDPTSPQIREAFAAAIADAKVRDVDSISRDLMPILPSTEGLVWNDDGQVLMATWTKSWYFDNPEIFIPGNTFPLGVDTWFIPVPLVSDFCRGLNLKPEMLTLRLEQWIGLPPGREKNAFVEMWVSPEDLFRPCPDPSIADHECQIEIPVIGRDQGAPWDCSLNEQVSGDFVTVRPGHLRWMCENWAGSYGHDELFDNYPWTALGYTYDWGNPDDPRGPSEYVALKGSPAVFHSRTATEAYCSRP